MPRQRRNAISGGQRQQYGGPHRVQGQRRPFDVYEYEEDPSSYRSIEWARDDAEEKQADEDRLVRYSSGYPSSESRLDRPTLWYDQEGGYSEYDLDPDYDYSGFQATVFGDNGEYLKNPKTGKYYNRKVYNKGLYDRTPGERALVQTSQRVPNTIVNRLAHQSGVFGDQFYDENEPLSIIPGAFEQPLNARYPGSRYQNRAIRYHQPLNQLDTSMRVGPVKDPLNAFLGGSGYSQSVRPGVSNSLPKSNCIEFTNTEFIQNLLPNNAAFAQIQISVNPGLYNSFPMLSQIASCFTYYRFKKLKFRFVSTCNDSMAASGSSVALGSVCMVHDANVAIPAPVSFFQQANYPGAKTFKPSLNVEYEIDCTARSTEEWYFCRTNPTYFNNGNIASVLPLSGLSSTQLAQNIFGTPGAYGTPGTPNIPNFANSLGSPQLTDFVNFYIACQGNNFSSALGLGELHVDYTVELRDCFLNGSVQGNQCLYYRAQFGSVGGITSGDGYIAPLVQGHGNVPISLDSTSVAMNIHFPAYISSGCWQIKFVMPSDGYWGDTQSDPSLRFPLTGTTSAYNVLGPLSISRTGTYSSIPQDVLYEYSFGVGNNGGGVYTENLYYYPAGQWGIAHVVCVNIQITAAPCTVTFPGFAGGSAAPTTFWQGSLSVVQLNPNFQYNWNYGGNNGGQSNP